MKRRERAEHRRAVRRPIVRSRRPREPRRRAGRDGDRLRRLAAGEDPSQAERPSNTGPGAPAGTPARSAGDLESIKRYLVEHSSALAGSTTELRTQGERYYGLARAVNFDYDRLLRERRTRGGPPARRRPRATYRRPTPSTRRWRASWPGCPRSRTTT